MMYNTILSIHMTFFDENAKDFLCQEIKERINKFKKMFDNTYGDQAEKHKHSLDEEEKYVSILEAASTLEFDVVLEIDVEKPNIFKYIVLYNDDPLFANKMYNDELISMRKFYYNPFKALNEMDVYEVIIYDIMYRMEYMERIPFNQKELFIGFYKPMIENILREYLSTTVRCKRNTLDEKKYKSIKKLLKKEEIDYE